MNANADDLDFIFGDLDPTEASPLVDPWTGEYWEGIEFDPVTGLYYEDPDEE